MPDSTPDIPIMTHFLEQSQESRRQTVCTYMNATLTKVDAAQTGNRQSLPKPKLKKDLELAPTVGLSINSSLV